MIRKPIDFIRKVILPFLSYKTFHLLIAIPQHSSYEDPNCPSRWRDISCRPSHPRNPAKVLTLSHLPQRQSP